MKPPVEIGFRTGTLEVISEPFKKNDGANYYVTCRCDCENEFDVIQHRIRNGNISQCKQCSSRKRRAVEIGEVYGSWTVIGETTDSEGWVAWLCQCLCGNTQTIRTSALRGGRSTQCIDCRSEGRRTGCEGTLWSIIRTRAKANGRELSVTWKQIKDLIEKQDYKCAVSGVPIKFAQSTDELEDGQNTASLDRIDSAKGYTIDNVQWVHKTVNRMKMNISEDRFIAFCHAVARKHPEPENAPELLTKDAPEFHESSPGRKKKHICSDQCGHKPSGSGFAALASIS